MRMVWLIFFNWMEVSVGVPFKLLYKFAFPSASRCLGALRVTRERDGTSLAKAAFVRGLILFIYLGKVKRSGWVQCFLGTS